MQILKKNEYQTKGTKMFLRMSTEESFTLKLGANNSKIKQYKINL